MCLGSLIRTGPKEVSFYSLDIYNTVHKIGSKFAKDPRNYGEFVQGGHPALFSITYVHDSIKLLTVFTSSVPISNIMIPRSDNEEHSQRRRLMGQLYNRSKMYILHDMMLEAVTSFVEALKLHAGSYVELVTACRALEADVICKSLYLATPPLNTCADFRL